MTPTPLALFSLLLACTADPPADDKVTDDSGTPTDSDTDTGEPLPPGDVAVSCASVSPDFPTVVELTWETDDAGTSTVAWTGEEADGTTPSSDESTSHRVVVYGLKPNASYTFRGTTTLGDGSTLQTDSCAVDLAPAPSDLPRFTLSLMDDARIEPGGFILTSIIGGNGTWAVILDRDAEPVWWVKGDQDIAVPTTDTGRDGKSITFTHAANNQSKDLGGIVRVALDGSSQIDTRAPLAHHDFVELPDGSYAYLMLDLDDPDDPTEALDAIVRVPEGAEEGVEPEVLWSYRSDYPKDENPCEVPYPDAYGTGAWDCTHANSLMYDDAQGAVFMMSKNLDHILKIDPTDWTLEWELGGPFGEFSLGAGASWSHPHMSSIWDGGACVFDNGYDYEPQASRITEVVIDEGARTVELAWEWQPDADEFVPLLGDCDKLPGGTYLTAWTNSGTLREVEPGGDIVWEAEIDLGNGIGRSMWIEDLYTLDR